MKRRAFKLYGVMGRIILSLSTVLHIWGHLQIIVKDLIWKRHNWLWKLTESPSQLILLKRAGLLLLVFTKDERCTFLCHTTDCVSSSTACAGILFFVPRSLWSCLTYIIKRPARLSHSGSGSLDRTTFSFQWKSIVRMLPTRPPSAAQQNNKWSRPLILNTYYQCNTTLHTLTFTYHVQKQTKNINS